MNVGTQYRIKSSQLSHQTFEDETVIIDLESGSYYSLNKVGTELWSLLEGDGSTGEQIGDEISRRYEADPQEIQTAVTDFLGELQRANLVVTTQAGITSQSQEQHSSVRLENKPPFNVPTLDTFTDMQELLLLDPIHEADDTGWPSAAPQAMHGNV